MLPDLTNAERRALEATRLESFPVNLQEIRRTVELLLKEFGRYDFFNEYTTHSYDHIHEMLTCLDWLVPESTKVQLTKGDWWLITLACYFHDLGLEPVFS
jgi:molecular chaperone HtpG